MQIAQELFESGLITYHRTDSTSVSSFGINLAKEYIKKNFGEGFFVGRSYRREGAHECIRPTRPIDSKKLKDLFFSRRMRFVKPLTEEHFMLYVLIFKRFIASQMKGVRVRYQILEVEVFQNRKKLELPVEIVEDGFNRLVYFRIMKEVRPGAYPIAFVKLKKVPKAWPFSQGELVGLMKEKRIGRPSTYSKIVQVLLDRKYIKETKSRLFNTKLGFKIYSFLVKRFKSYVSEETTRKLEDAMRRIEEGKEEYMEVLRALYSEIRGLEEG